MLQVSSHSNATASILYSTTHEIKSHSFLILYFNVLVPKLCPLEAK